MSIIARETFLKRQQQQDREELMWAGISRADHAFLTARRPTAVARKYAEALASASEGGRGSARAQLEIFQRLGVRSEFVAAALGAIDTLDTPPSVSAAKAQPAVQKPKPPARVLLFTGHMIDAPDRTSPRFPATAAAETAARQMIRDSIQEERSHEAGVIVGIGGGACGGDILFHELCEELGIESQLFLALPQGAFSATSVQHAGKNWVERYNTLCARVRPRVLGETKDLTVWLRLKPEYGIWQRNSLWMLFNALALDAKSLTLIALWDGGAADGPGGTKDLVTQVRERGHKVDRLPAERLKQLV